MKGGSSQIPTAYPAPPSGSSAPTVTGTFVPDNDTEAAHPTAIATPVNSSAIPAFRVQVPAGCGPGSEFEFDLADGSTRRMIVPEGAGPGMVLSAIIIPRSVRPGGEVLVSTDEGDLAVTIPAGMRPGELLVIDAGTDLRQWVDDSGGGFDGDWQPRRSCCQIVAGVVFVLLCLVAIGYLFAPHGGYGSYGHGYSHGYGGSVGGPNYYHQHLLDHSDVQYGAAPPPPVDPEIDPNDFPGQEDGFERGTDESGAEVFRYEQNEQVRAREEEEGERAGG